MKIKAKKKKTKTSTQKSMESLEQILNINSLIIQRTQTCNYYSELQCAAMFYKEEELFRRFHMWCFLTLTEIF